MERGDSKLWVYKKFKRSIYIENYLVMSTNNNSIPKRKDFTKLRISAHQLRIETGRYSRPKTPVEKRICQFCDTQSVESELHFLLDCSHYKAERDTFFKTLNSFTDFSSLDAEDRFHFIMTYNGGDTEVARAVLDYTRVITEKRAGMA